jgi:hypothetical protein
MKWPEFQFQMKGILLAIFWLAICFSAYAMVIDMHRRRVSSPMEVPLTLVMMVAPVVAIGALFGRTLLGAAIGIAGLSAFWFVWHLT